MKLLLPVCVFILLFPTIGSFEAIGENISNINLSIRQITTEGNNQVTPLINGDTIIWEDHSNQSNSNIRGYRIKEEQQFILTSDLNNQLRPTIYDKRVIWTTIDTNNIIGYDLEKNQEVTYISGTNLSFDYLSLFEDKLVGIDFSNEFDVKILLYNLTTKEEHVIQTGLTEHCGVKIWEDLIIYEDYENNTTWIKGYNVTTKEEFLIINESGGFVSYQGKYLLYGVYTGNPSSENCTYYLYNIDTRKIEQKIPTIPWGWDSMWGDFIVGSYFYIYQISEGKLFNFTHQFHTCSIFENKIACDNQDNNVVLIEFTFPDGNNTNGTDDGKGHNSLTIPSATMSFLVMAIIIIAVVRRRQG